MKRILLCIMILAGTASAGIIPVRTDRITRDSTAFHYWPEINTADFYIVGDVNITGDFVLSGLTASRLIATDANKVLISVADLASWVAGTTDQVIVTADGDGTITLSLPQDVNTTSSPTFAGLTLTTSPSDGYVWTSDANGLGSWTLLSYARYEFAGNDFNGTGDFYTTGTGTFGDITVTDTVDTASLIVDSNAPATYDAAGAAGQITWDSSYIYVCVATDSWKRASIVAWGVEENVIYAGEDVIYAGEQVEYP